jgi:hypothetical protein
MAELTIEPGPPNASTDPTTGLRSYRWQGVSYPSVTSIRRMAGVPHGLVAWQVSQVVKRATTDIETLNAMLTRDRKPREQVLEKNRIAEAGRWLRSAATEERDRTAALGTAVHDAAASGKRPEDVAEELRPRLRQYIDFLAVSGAEVVGSEFQCWSPSIGYAGTCDALMRFPSGQLHVVDLKTGSGLYAEYALQVMAYAMADFVGTNDVIDQALTDALHAHTGLGVLHLADDGWSYSVIKRDPETWAAFRGLLTFARWMSAHPDAASITAAVRKSGERDVTNTRIEKGFAALKEGIAA